MSQKHYKGPYEISPRVNTNRYGAIEILIDAPAAFSEQIACVYAHDKNDQQAFATAKLFSASADMLEALKGIADYVTRDLILCHGAKEREIAVILRDVRAAIDKAEGGQP